MAEKGTFRFRHVWDAIGSIFPNFSKIFRINRNLLLPLPYICRIYPSLSTIDYRMLFCSQTGQNPNKKQISPNEYRMVPE
jgi:hypothetical protein